MAKHPSEIACPELNHREIFGEHLEKQFQSVLSYYVTSLTAMSLEKDAQDWIDQHTSGWDDEAVAWLKSVKCKGGGCKKSYIFISPKASGDMDPIEAILDRRTKAIIGYKTRAWVDPAIAHVSCVPANDDD
jgi:hypothetical protein